MSEGDKVVGIRPSTPVVEGVDTTKQVCRGLRRLAEKIENGDYGPVEYGVLGLSLATVDRPPLFIGFADMRRDSAIGIMTMGAQALCVDDLEHMR